jgi:archaellum component FlaG (FlaF/FlaG flagellin family)
MANELVEPADNTAAKVYIKNVGNTAGVIDKATGVKVLINSVEIGVLYGGDWLMMPVTVVDAEDIEVQPLTDGTVILEYAMFYEEG